MPINVHGAKPENLSEVHSVIHETFCAHSPQDILVPYYIAEENCDPEFRPEQCRFRRLHGRVASVVKVYVRKLHHPDGPVPVTIIGSVCTRKSMRGRGLVGAVIEDSLAYSKSIGAQGMLIVTPREDYYLRYGFKYFRTFSVAGQIPEETHVSGHVEPLVSCDAGWMTEMYNAAAKGYGPMIRSGEYMRKWVLERGLTQLDTHGFRLVRRNRPVAYGIFSLHDDKLRLLEICSRSLNGADEAALLSFWTHLGQKRFMCYLPSRHPLIKYLRSTGRSVRKKLLKQFMYYSLAPEFPIPDESFDFSRIDFV